MAGQAAALRGDHRTALGHYREAMHLVVRERLPEVVFRHYLEATVESLELMGAYREVLDYCERAIGHYDINPPANDLALLDLATIHQRLGVVLLKSGDREGGRIALEAALATVARGGGRLELAHLLLGWLQRGLTISPDRILTEQRRLHYFSVRAGPGDASAAATSRRRTRQPGAGDPVGGLPAAAPEPPTGPSAPDAPAGPLGVR
jgi:tetratricopeptide (TPR) repeat protein